MKAVTEFASFTLNAALKQRAALAAEGKTPEEIQEALGASFKVEAEKLGHLMQALEIATSNPDNLKRVMVMRLSEGEKAPAKAVQMEDLCYVPEFHIDLKAQRAAKEARDAAKGGKGGRGKRGGGGRDGGRGGGKRDGGNKGDGGPAVAGRGGTGIVKAQRT